MAALAVLLEDGKNVAIKWWGEAASGRAGELWNGKLRQSELRPAAREAKMGPAIRNRSRRTRSIAI